MNAEISFKKWAIPLFLALLCPWTSVTAQQIRIGNGGGIRIQGGGRIILNGGNLIINGNGQQIRLDNGQQAQDPTPTKQPRLLLNNGESLDGELVSADDASITWHSPLFAESLELRSTSLMRVESPPQAAKTTTEPFSILFRNGDLMHADIVSLTADALTLRRSGQADMSVPMAQVQTIRRHAGLPFQGPTGLAGWAGHRPDRLTDWFNSSRGTLATRTWNRAISLTVDLPQSALLEVVVSSTQRPKFSLSFSKIDGESPTVETWDNELVASEGLTFAPLRTLDEADRAVALRMIFDRANKKLSVFDWTGKHLADLPCERSLTQPGFTVRNKGSDLTLELLSIRAWDGKALATLDPKKPRADLVDGRSLNATLRGSATGCEIVPSDGSAALSVAWDQLAAFDSGARDASKIIDNRTPLAQMIVEQPIANAPATRLSFADGSTLTGDLVSIEKGIASVRTSIAAQPLQAPLAEMTRMTLHEPPQASDKPQPKLEQLDVLNISGHALHGQLTGTGEASFRWLVPGASKSAALSTPVPTDMSVTRAASPSNVADLAPALFFLRDGSVVTGELTSISAEGAGLKSPITALDRIAADQLNAIHFRPQQTTAKNFDDGLWQVIKGTEAEAKLSPDKLVLSGAGSIGHPSIMFGNEISFDLAMPSFWGAIAVGLFVGDLDDKLPATRVHFLFSSDDFWCAVEDAEGGSRTSEQLHGLSRKTVSVRMVLGDTQLQIFANGLPLVTAPLDAEKRKGAGLVFSPSSMWGSNQARTVEVTNFSVSTQADYLQLPTISAKVREQALLIPRFRRDTPPTHVLLAPNGDVLRGRIEGATAKSIKFVSGLDSIDVPTERVAAAVWLRPAVAEKAQPAAPSASNQQIENKDAAALTNAVAGFIAAGNPPPIQASGVQVDPQAMRPAQAAAVVNNPAQVQAFAIVPQAAQANPAPANGAVMNIVVNGQPVAAPPPGAGLIPLPPDAAAVPQITAASATLTSPNSLLSKRSDFSPTHWLTLHDGAQLALAVQSFEPETIVASSPSLGSCRIPLKSVSVLRIAAPAPSRAMLTYQDWQLEYAPEPVLPESGGEASPLLGKAAPDFTLPLAGGGQFTLAAEKGNVIVLDFWATWCGPCVGSMPEQIKTMAQFAGLPVKFITVNQGEPEEAVLKFIQQRSWAIAVALDQQQTVGKKFGVEGIPHTVVIGPTGNIEWSITGAAPGNTEQMTAVIRKLLGIKTASAP